MSVPRPPMGVTRDEGRHVSARARRRTDRRHQAREAALQVLYHWEVAGSDVDQAAETFFAAQWPGKEPPPGDLRAFASGLARDTVARLGDIDPLIAEAAEHWRPERMAIVDRLILRMAVCELLRDPGTPRAVIINEALELARTFGTEESVRFVNGVLDAIAKQP